MGIPIWCWSAVFRSGRLFCVTWVDGLGMSASSPFSRRKDCGWIHLCTINRYCCGIFGKHRATDPRLGVVYCLDSFVFCPWKHSQRTGVFLAFNDEGLWYQLAGAECLNTDKAVCWYHHGPEYWWSSMGTRSFHWLHQCCADLDAYFRLGADFCLYRCDV